ncbi:MAG: hypothetical protein P4N41_12415 [Negativicutes bacterium]|nr:hypothetical protein [Negativicutes bacterium]
MKPTLPTALACGERVRIMTGGNLWGYRGTVAQRVDPIYIALTGEYCELYQVAMTAPPHENGQYRVLPLSCLTKED